jgi:c(7)-type cytochrome triheme protein
MGDQRLPKDRYGLIDWVKLVKGNMIAPKPSLDPTFEEMPPLNMDVLIEAKGDFVDDVVYPHWIHTYWLKCDVCHPKIFIPAKGQNNMTMVGIAEGKWCGRCHGKVAFPLTDCSRCHVKPKKSAKK